MGCAAAARVVLKRIDGVEAAMVSYEEGRGMIVYDPTITSPDAFIPELEEMTGYDATLVDDVPGGTVDADHGDHVESDSAHVHTEEHDEHR